MQPGELLQFLVETYLKHIGDDEHSLDDLLPGDDRLKELIDGEDSEEEEGEGKKEENKDEQEKERPRTKRVDCQKPQKTKDPKKCLIS